MKNYEDILKSPEWKSKRLEILNRDKHTCQRCGIKTKIHINTLALEFEITEIIGTFFRFFREEHIDSPLLHIQKNLVNLIAKTNIEELDIDCDGYYLIINFIHKDFINKKFSGSI